MITQNTYQKGDFLSRSNFWLFNLKDLEIQTFYLKKYFMFLNLKEIIHKGL